LQKQRANPYRDTASVLEVEKSDGGMDRATMKEEKKHFGVGIL